MSSMKTQTSHAIILAAGFGSRLQPEEGHKLLVELGGRTLLEWHLANFAKLGVVDVTVVTGYRNEALARQLDEVARPDALRLHTAYTEDFESSNGISVLAGLDSALEVLGTERALPFWLTMSDHVFDPALFDRLAERFLPARADDYQGMLGVDRKLDQIFDMPDANKVSLVDGQLRAIGKQLERFEMVDVGLFWCARGFVEALRAERGERGDCTTSDAVRRLAKRDAFCFWDIGPHLWQDVDTPEAREHAEELVSRWETASEE